MIFFESFLFVFKSETFVFVALFITWKLKKLGNESWKTYPVTFISTPRIDGWFIVCLRYPDFVLKKTWKSDWIDKNSKKNSQVKK